MDIQEKQAKWKQERPLFEAAFIHSHLLPFFNFNENTGDYEIKSEYENDEDRALSFNVLNTGWAMWLRAKRDTKAQAVLEGFVLVKIDDLELLRDSALKIKYASLNNDSVRIFSDIGDIQLSIERLIEAQEQG